MNSPVLQYAQHLDQILAMNISHGHGYILPLPAVFKRRLTSLATHTPQPQLPTGHSSPTPPKGGNHKHLLNRYVSATKYGTNGPRGGRH